MKNKKDIILAVILVLGLGFGIGTTILIANSPAPKVSELVDGKINVFAVQSDGKKIIGGDFAKRHIVRADSAGLVDESFGAGNTVGFFNAPVHTLKILANDSILVGGAFTNYDQQIVGGFIKLSADGQVDLEFASKLGTGFDDKVMKIELTKDGKILVAGAFRKFNGKDAHGLVRLNADGSVDESFNIGEGFDKTVQALFVSEKNEFHVGGNFTMFNGKPKNYYLKLDASGNLIWRADLV